MNFLSFYAVNLNSPSAVERLVKAVLLDSKDVLPKIIHVKFTPDVDSASGQQNAKNENVVHMDGLYTITTDLMGLDVTLRLNGTMIFGEKYQAFKQQDAFIIDGTFTGEKVEITTEALEFVERETVIAEILKEYLNISDLLIMLQRGLSHNTLNTVTTTFDNYSNELNALSSQ